MYTEARIEKNAQEAKYELGGRQTDACYATHPSSDTPEVLSR